MTTNRMTDTFSVTAAEADSVTITLNRAQAAALAETLALNVDDDTVRYDNNEPERADLVRDLARDILTITDGVVGSPKPFGGERFDALRPFGMQIPSLPATEV
jgi:ApbE superfamily uncharacterized protein (UPF0280 family)